MYEELNEKQISILKFIESYINSNGYPPSIREICEGTNLKSTSTVHKHMGELEKFGYIRKDATKPRAIELVDSSIDLDTEYRIIPLVGEITAGNPVLAYENIQENYRLPIALVSDSDYILRVRGESMIEAGILDGDYIMVKKQSTAKNGDIVVALIDDEATVKRYFKEKDLIRLQPENAAMDPIITDNVKILGIVKHVHRKI